MDRVYFDWAATAPLCVESQKAMEPYMLGGMANLAVSANANSLHSEGRAAFAAMEEARGVVARAIGARPDEITFMSGATESDNTALLGISHNRYGAFKQEGRTGLKGHLIVSAIEHDAVHQTARMLERVGIDVSYLQPDANGFVSPDDLKANLRPDTVLVSVMLANNEIGSIQPIKELAEVAHGCGALFHTDATQAMGKMPISVTELGVDAMSFSSHKVCGPKGVGALYLKHGVTCDSLMLGGGQESGMRSGTQNVPGIVGFAAAMKAFCSDPVAIEAEANRQRALRDRLYEGLLAYPQVVKTIDCHEGDTRFLPNIANVCVRGYESETLILRFDREGVALSGGSACSSHSLEPSRVLKTIGIERDLALCSLRFSLGAFTTSEDVEYALEAFDRVVNWNKR